MSPSWLRQGALMRMMAVWLWNLIDGHQAVRPKVVHAKRRKVGLMIVPAEDLAVRHHGQAWLRRQLPPVVRHPSGLASTTQMPVDPVCDAMGQVLNDEGWADEEEREYVRASVRGVTNIVEMLELALQGACLSALWRRRRSQGTPASSPCELSACRFPS